MNVLLIANVFFNYLFLLNQRNAPTAAITSNKTTKIVAAATVTIWLSLEWSLLGSSSMEELLTVDILLVVTKGIFSVFLVLVKLVGTNFETVALETLVLLLKRALMWLMEISVTDLLDLKHWEDKFNPFIPSASFLYLLKTTENLNVLWFFSE